MITVKNYIKQLENDYKEKIITSFTNYMIHTIHKKGILKPKISLRLKRFLIKKIQK